MTPFFRRNRFPGSADEFRVRKDLVIKGTLYYSDLLSTTLVWDKMLMCPHMPPVLLAEISFSSGEPNTGQAQNNKILNKSKPYYAMDSKNY